MSNFASEIESTKNEELTNLYEKYKKTDEYKSYSEMIKNDKPELTTYLIDIIMYGFFHEEYLNNLPYEERVKHTSLLQREQKIIPPVQGEMKGVGVYSSMEEYKELNPDIKEIKVVGEPLTLIEHKPTEIESHIKDLLNEPVEGPKYYEAKLEGLTGSGIGHSTTQILKSHEKYIEEESETLDEDKEELELLQKTIEKLKKLENEFF